jgi:hypothetical protein
VAGVQAQTRPSDGRRLSPRALPPRLPGQLGPPNANGKLSFKSYISLIIYFSSLKLIFKLAYLNYKSPKIFSNSSFFINLFIFNLILLYFSQISSNSFFLESKLPLISFIFSLNFFLSLYFSFNTFNKLPVSVYSLP